MNSCRFVVFCIVWSEETVAEDSLNIISLQRIINFQIFCEKSNQIFFTIVSKFKK
jgi:hypothetical protein